MQVHKSISDNELIERITSGEEDLFEEIINRYQGAVATTTMNMLCDAEDSAEVGQQVFIQVYRSLARFRKQSSLKTYITRIAINHCINFLKRRKNFFGRSYELNKARNVRIKSEANQFEYKELLNQAFQNLDDKHRSVIVLRMIQGYSTIETAEILDVPKGTVLSRLARGMDKLKIILEEELKYEHQ